MSARPHSSICRSSTTTQLSPSSLSVSQVLTYTTGCLPLGEGGGLLTGEGGGEGGVTTLLLSVAWGGGPTPRARRSLLSEALTEAERTVLLVPIQVVVRETLYCADLLLGRLPGRDWLGLFVNRPAAPGTS